MVEEGDEIIEMQLGKAGLCPSSETRVRALPGRVQGTAHPKTSQEGRRNAEFHSPQFGGESSVLAAAGASGGA
eukprot:3686614-Amphidinium_carterae.1